MNRYDIRYLKKAQDDLIDIFEYIKLDNLLAAKNFVNKIDRTIKILERFPFSGIIPKDNRLKIKGYRIVIVDDYLVFYIFKEKVVEIHRIIHGRRRYSFLL